MRILGHSRNCSLGHQSLRSHVGMKLLRPARGERRELSCVVESIQPDQRFCQQAVDLPHEPVLLRQGNRERFAQPLLGRGRVVAGERVLGEGDQVLDLEVRLARALEQTARLLP